MLRLFGYYALHAFVNQVRKLLKTWVLVLILACFLLGGIIGFGAARISDLAEQHQETEITQETEEETEPEILFEESVPDPAPAAMTEEETRQLFELVGGILLLVLFLFRAFTADTSASKIFLPADVNLLFASPMKPQSVLMFRLMTQIGMMVFFAFYYLIQIPNLMNMGLSLPAAITCIFIFFAAIIISTLIQLLIYILASNYPAFARNFRYGLYALIGIVAVSFILYQRLNRMDLFDATVSFFTSPLSRMIPLWGWLKGILAGAVAGNAGQVILYAALTIAGSAGMVYLIWQIPVDFYEDAMFKSEEKAELMRLAQESRSGLVFSKRKKDRADSLQRDGLRHGHGANVFFFKSMYNRFRFARFRVFTKTMGTYLVTAIGICLFVRFALESGAGFVPAVIAVAILAFYRSLGNPLEEDMKCDYFRLIPAPTFSKLFYSLLGGTLNCMMDTFPAFFIAALITQTNPLSAVWWTLFVAAVDFYATCTGAFIYLSLPQNAGATVKQVVQILFLYFGLLPSAGLMIVGIVTDRLLLFALLTALVNAGLGAIFLALAAMVLDPGEGTVTSETTARGQFSGEAVSYADPADLKPARRCFSRLSLAAGIMLFITILLANIFVAGLAISVPAFMVHYPWMEEVLLYGSMYLIGFPVLLLIIRVIPRMKPVESKRLGILPLLGVLCICQFFSIIGQFVSTWINAFLSDTFGLDMGDLLMENMLEMSTFSLIVSTVIIAPVMEEVLFRRIMIDRMRPYGERLAVITSSILFGMFHGNLSQVVYASAIGLVLGYVYLYTGRLRYPVALHFLNNLISVISTLMLRSLDADMLAYMKEWDITKLGSLPPALPPAATGVVALELLNYAMIFFGIILFILWIKKVHFRKAPLELPRGKRFTTVWVNAGMFVFLVAVLIQFAMAYWAASLMA